MPMHSLLMQGKKATNDDAYLKQEATAHRLYPMSRRFLLTLSLQNRRGYLAT